MNRAIFFCSSLIVASAAPMRVQAMPSIASEINCLYETEVEHYSPVVKALDTRAAGIEKSVLVIMGDAVSSVALDEKNNIQSPSQPGCYSQFQKVTISGQTVFLDTLLCRGDGMGTNTTTAYTDPKKDIYEGKNLTEADFKTALAVPLSGVELQRAREKLESKLRASLVSLTADARGSLAARAAQEPPSKTSDWREELPQLKINEMRVQKACANLGSESQSITRELQVLESQLNQMRDVKATKAD